MNAATWHDVGSPLGLYVGDGATLRIAKVVKRPQPVGRLHPDLAERFGVRESRMMPLYMAGVEEAYVLRRMLERALGPDRGIRNFDDERGYAVIEQGGDRWVRQAPEHAWVVVIDLQDHILVFARRGGRRCCFYPGQAPTWRPSRDISALKSASRAIQLEARDPQMDIVKAQTTDARDATLRDYLEGDRFPPSAWFTLRPRAERAEEYGKMVEQWRSRKGKG